MLARRSNIAATVALALGALALGCDSPSVVSQPLDFSHKRHAEADIDCLTCHEQAADAPVATLPPLRACMKCHKEPQGKEPDEAKVREYAEKGEPIPWVQVNWLPGHVYFSHRAHVGFAEMECKACHGDMAQLTHSLDRPNTDHLSMSACMACHEQKNASNDCVACHK